jgi:hypothetical protein
VIKNYLRATFDKLGVWSRLELALYVAAHGGADWRNPATLAPTAPPAITEILRPLPQTAQTASAGLGNSDPQSGQSPYKPKVSPRLISA